MKPSEYPLFTDASGNNATCPDCNSNELLRVVPNTGTSYCLKCRAVGGMREETSSRPKPGVALDLIGAGDTNDSPYVNPPAVKVGKAGPRGRYTQSLLDAEEVLREAEKHDRNNAARRRAANAAVDADFTLARAFESL